MPFSSTIRTDGIPSGEAVASAMASGSNSPSASASSNQARILSSASGVFPGRASGQPSECHRDVLDLEVLVDALGAALAPEAGRLDAAERRRRVGHDPLVEADHAGLEALTDAERALDVGRVDVAHEPEL